MILFILKQQYWFGRWRMSLWARAHVELLPVQRCFHIRCSVIVQQYSEWVTGSCQNHWTELPGHHLEIQILLFCQWTRDYNHQGVCALTTIVPEHISALSFPIMLGGYENGGWAGWWGFLLWILSKLTIWQHIAAPLIRSTSQSKQKASADGRHVFTHKLWHLTPSRRQINRTWSPNHDWSWIQSSAENNYDRQPHLVHINPFNARVWAKYGIR